MADPDAVPLCYQGRPVTELSRGELIRALAHCAKSWQRDQQRVLQAMDSLNPHKKQFAAQFLRRYSQIG